MDGTVFPPAFRTAGSEAGMLVLTKAGIISISVPEDMPALLRDFSREVIRAQVGTVSPLLCSPRACCLLVPCRRC